MTTDNRTLLIGSLQVIMAGICWGTLGIFSTQLGKLILGEQISVKSALLAIIAVIGVACLMVGDKFSLNMGVIVGLLSGLCYSLYGILGKKTMSFNHSTQMVFFSSVSFSAIALLFLPQTFAIYQTLSTLPIRHGLMSLG